MQAILLSALFSFALTTMLMAQTCREVLRETPLGGSSRPSSARNRPAEPSGR